MSSRTTSLLSFNLLVFILGLFLFSCSSLPNDLQARKDAIANKLTELNKAYEAASGIPAYKQLIVDYTNLRAEISSYTTACNARGISKNNDALIKEIDEKIARFKTSVEISQGYVDMTSNTSTKNTRTVYSGGYPVEIDMTIPNGYEEGFTCSDCDGEGVVHDNGMGKKIDMICPGCAGRGFQLRKKRSY